MLNEEIVEEILIEAHRLGIYNEVFDMASSIKTQQDFASKCQIAFEQIKNSKRND